MAKKKEEEVKKGLDEWMGTFSDMMTLLMCFFVLLFSMSTVDAAKFEEVAQSFQSTISIFKGGAMAIGDGILVSAGVSQLNMLDEFINSSGKTADSNSQNENIDKTEDSSPNSDTKSEQIKEAAEMLGLDAEQAQELAETLAQIEQEKLELSEELAEKIEESVKENMIENEVDVTVNADYVLITFNGAFLFDSGQADLKPDALPVLNKMGRILARYAQWDIEIEGHTDSVPLNGGRYENNDVLSSYRALAVFDYLKENSSLDPSLMKHSGRGEYMPVADNAVPEGRAKNRRVEIKVYNSLSSGLMN